METCGYCKDPIPDDHIFTQCMTCQQCFHDTPSGKCYQEHLINDKCDGYCCCVLDPNYVIDLTDTQDLPDVSVIDIICDPPIL